MHALRMRVHAPAWPRPRGASGPSRTPPPCAALAWGRYAAVKEGWKALLLEVLYRHVPQAEGHVVFTDVGTPLSNDFYLGSVRGEVHGLSQWFTPSSQWCAPSPPQVRGEVYGLSHAVERYDRRDALLALHPQTTVPGLYLTGQDCLFVGVVSALMSGLLTATRVSYLAALRCVVEIVLS